MKCGRILLILLVFFLHGAVTGAQETLEPTPRLTVRGASDLQVPADQVTMKISVVSSSDSVKDALALNSRKAKDVEKSLLRSGVTEKEYETGRFQIQPIWAQRPLKSSGEWEPRITAYSVTNTFTVKTKKMELVGSIIEAAVESGANAVDSISFGLADPSEYRKQAIEEAVANARNDAQSLAAASGVQLGAALDISLDGSSTGVVPMRAFGLTQDMQSTPPTIKPGDVTVRAGVVLTYQIQ